MYFLDLNGRVGDRSKTSLCHSYIMYTWKQNGLANQVYLKVFVKQ